MRPFLLAAATFVVAGCLGGPSEDVAAGPRAAPAEWGLDEAHGVILGQILDDESWPLIGAKVRLEETGAEAVSGPDGGFVFPQVRAGTVRIASAMDGHLSVQKTAEVVAGQVTDVEIVLPKLPTDHPYHETVVHAGFISFGNWVIDVAGPAMGIDALCERCIMEFWTRPFAHAIALEPLFDGAFTKPVGEATMGFGLYDADAADATQGAEGVYASGWWTSGDRVPVEQAWPDDEVRMYLYNGCDATWVCTEQRFEVYVTVFYHGPMPDDFSALPDA